MKPFVRNTTYDLPFYALQDFGPDQSWVYVFERFNNGNYKTLNVQKYAHRKPTKAQQVSLNMNMAPSGSWQIVTEAELPADVLKRFQEGRSARNLGSHQKFHAMSGITMTYGVLPSYAKFEAAFNRECPDGIYMISNDKGGRDGDYTASRLWGLLGRELKRFENHDAYAEDEDNEEAAEAGDFCSAVLSTLGFEWI